MPQRKTRAVTGNGSPASESRNGQQAPTYREVFARTGETPAGNIEWLLSFVGLPLEGFDVHGRAALIEEVFAVCTLAGSAKPAVWKKAQLPGFRDYPGYPEFAHPFFGQRWREVLSLYTIAREAVTRCADRLPLRLPKIKMEMDLNFDQWGTKEPRPTGAPFWVFPPTRADEEMEGAFIYRLACVLALEGDRIGRCQSHTCRRPLRLFIKTKSDQIFCSNTCRSRDAMKRLRHRAEYARFLQEVERYKSQLSNKKGVSRHGTKQ